MELLLKLLGLLLRLVVFALTGEWPSSDGDRDAPVPDVSRRGGPQAARPSRPDRPRRSEMASGLAPFVEGGPAASADATALLLADVETCLRALAEPVVEHVRAHSAALPGLRFVASAERNQAAADDVQAEVVTVRVAPTLRDLPERWVLLAREVGRSLFEVVPGWSIESYRANRLPPQLLLPPAHAMYDADTARAAIGVWLPELFADVYATFTLGPGYASALLSLVSRPKQPAETLMGRAEGRFLSRMAPAVLRMHASRAVLTRLGFHDAERTLGARFDASHGVAESMYLPLSDGRLMAIPLAFMVGELDEVLANWLDAPQAALANEAWLDVPGFAFLHGEQAQAQAAASLLSRGQALDAPPRILLAAAVLALDGNTRDSTRANVARALGRSIRGAETLEAAPNAYDAPTLRDRSRTGSLAAAFRDPSTVREALILGAALAPNRRKQPRS